MKVRTRIAPSPTGEDIHIGNLYTALINFAVAKQNDGSFIIRIEDTDRQRYLEGSEQKILSSLKAYGLQYDEARMSEENMLRIVNQNGYHSIESMLRNL
jgi:glutamyl/glutaminyl-tRNA synthetase